MDVEKFRRGDLWWYNDSIPDKSLAERGVVRGSRPIVIISEISNSTSACTFSFLPITKGESAKAHGENYMHDMYMISIDVPGGCNSLVCCNQPTTATTNHLSGYIGHITDDKFDEVYEELFRYLGIDIKISGSHVRSTSTCLTNNSDHIAQTSISDNVNNCSDCSSPSKYAKYVCIETNKTYNSIRDAAACEGISYGYVQKSITNGQSIHGKTFKKCAEET